MKCRCDFWCSWGGGEGGGFPEKEKSHRSIPVAMVCDGMWVPRWCLFEVELFDEAFCSAVVVHDREHIAYVHYYAALEGCVKLDVA